MKSKIILFTYLLVAIISSCYPSNSLKKMFSGSIMFPCELNFSDLCLFYKGEKLKLELHGSANLVEYSFSDDPQIHSIYIIITPQVTHATQINNTLSGLMLHPSSEYICYKLEAKRDSNLFDDSSILSWEIFDTKLTDKQIPLNSFIFLFDPKCIAGLKVQSWKAENTFRVIPTIVIDSLVPKEQLDKALVAGQLAALDIAPVHTLAQEYCLPAHINNKHT